MRQQSPEEKGVVAAGMAVEVVVAAGIAAGAEAVHFMDLLPIAAWLMGGVAMH